MFVPPYMCLDRRLRFARFCPKVVQQPSFYFLVSFMNATFQVERSESPDNLILLFLYAFTILFTLSSGFQVISSSEVESGFRNVDRRFFVPEVSSFASYIMTPPRHDLFVSYRIYHIVPLRCCHILRTVKRLPIPINRSRKDMSTFLPHTYTEASWRH